MSAMTMKSDALVPLRNGPAVPESLVLWLLDAEDRGMHFRIEANGRLHVGPRDRVSAEDLAFMRAHRDALLACVAYLDQQAPA